jgi:hypothetical protein
MPFAMGEAVVASKRTPPEIIKMRALALKAARSPFARTASRPLSRRIHQLQLGATYEDAEPMADRGIEQLFDVRVTRVSSIGQIAAAVALAIPFGKVAIERSIGNHDDSLSESSFRLREAFRRIVGNSGDVTANCGSRRWQRK